MIIDVKIFLLFLQFLEEILQNWNIYNSARIFRIYSKDFFVGLRSGDWASHSKSGILFCFKATSWRACMYALGLYHAETNNCHHNFSSYNIAYDLASCILPRIWTNRPTHFREDASLASSFLLYAFFSITWPSPWLIVGITHFKSCLLFLGHWE